MIRCRMTKTDNLITKVHIMGHANSAGEGEYDAICGSVSIASQMMLVGIGNVLMIEPKKYTIDIGGQLTVELTNVQAEKSKILTESFYEMITMLQNQYKNYLKVEVENEETI